MATGVAAIVGTKGVDRKMRCLLARTKRVVGTGGDRKSRLRQGRSVVVRGNEGNSGG